MTSDATPEEFLDPEADAESQDPDLGFETTTSRLRSLWAPWMCRKGPGQYSDPTFFGKKIGGVPAAAVAAYAALETALQTVGYHPRSRWAYNCRKIGGTNNLSLHSAGIAIDLDPTENPFSVGDPFAGKLQRQHVDAVLAIRNSDGQSIWSWGGRWSKPDRMHFQLDAGPDAVNVDWSTVPGAAVSLRDATESEPDFIPRQEDDNVLGSGSKGRAVLRFQERLRAWNIDALPRSGADGDFGDETAEWVKRFQSAFGLDATGTIDGVTAALLCSDVED